MAEVIDWKREYVELTKMLWRGYSVYSSAGATSAAFERHVWPAISAARRRLKRDDPPGKRADSAVLRDLADDLEKIKDEEAAMSTAPDGLGWPAHDQRVSLALGVPLRPYTTSIDAILSLTNRAVYDYQEGWVNGHVGGTPFGEVGRFKSYAATPELSLLASTLRALAEEDEPNVLYAVGYKDSVGFHGMVYGPVPHLQDCLRTVPDPKEKDVAYVVRFTGGVNGWNGENKIVARWSPTSERWIERKLPS